MSSSQETAIREVPMPTATLLRILDALDACDEAREWVATQPDELPDLRKRVRGWSSVEAGEVTAKHKHEAVAGLTRQYPYRGPIEIPVRPNSKARGGVCVIEECACGARRSSNVSGDHTESGAWKRENGERA